MIVEKLIELSLLSDVIARKIVLPTTHQYDKRKMIARYVELKNEFLEPYVKDSNT